VASVTIIVDSAALRVDDTLHATAKAQDATGHVLSGITFLWSSADGSIASVSDKGDILGKQSGVVSIRVTAGKAIDELAFRVFPRVPGAPFNLTGYGIETSLGGSVSLQWQHDGSPATLTLFEWRFPSTDTLWSVPPGPSASGMATSWRSDYTVQRRYPISVRARRCDGNSPLQSCSAYSLVLVIDTWRP
jgi:hypothetical protein